MPEIKAIIFDLDGTLLNTLDDLADSMNRVLMRMHFPVHPVNAYKYFVGDGIEKLAFRALPESKRDPQTVTACVEKMLREYGDHCQDKTALYKGVKEMLSVLETRNILLNILSNKPDKLTQKTVATYLGKWHFKIIAGAVPERAKKPDPSGAIRIANKLDVPCENILYMGDTKTDMVTAKKAGMYAVGATWGFRSAKELQESGAQELVERPLQVLDLI